MSDYRQLSLDAWIDHLENRYDTPIQFGLERLRAVAMQLDALSFTVPIITVAGTNGKGSTVATLEAIYRAAGYHVGCYTSPHLFYYNERIRVDGECISDEALCELFCLIEAARGDIELTYFEVSTLAAFLYFKAKPLDVVIFEVGMGGRLDATNCVDADLAIITTVALDHQAYLGTTLDAIGYEKAGILRTNQPCIYADTDPPSTVLAQAQWLNAPLYRLQKEGGRGAYWFNTTATTFEMTFPEGGQCVLPLPGIHCKSAAAAVMASQVLKDVLPVDTAALVEAMQSVFIPGRQQIFVNEGITTVFDVAHNPQAVMQLATLVTQLRKQGRGRVRAVFAALKDKDLLGVIEPMCDGVDEWYLAELPGPRAMAAATLVDLVHVATHTNPLYFDNPMMAYCSAIEQSKKDDILVVYGSFLTVGPVMLAAGYDKLKRGNREII